VENDIAIQLGKRVRELRAAKKLTQEELAGRSGISLKYIQQIEGKNPSSLGLVKLQELANGFSMPLWELLKFK